MANMPTAYMMNSVGIMTSTIALSMYNVKYVSREKCKNRQTARAFMYAAIVVMLWTLFSTFLFYNREYFQMNIPSTSDWDRFLYIIVMTIVSNVVLLFLTIINIDLTRNDTDRYFSVCKNISISGLNKEVSAKNTASSVKDIFDFKDRVDAMHVAWVENKSSQKMSRRDLDEWDALSGYYNGVESTMKAISSQNLDTKADTFDNEWKFINDSAYKTTAKNWLKDMNVYPEDEATFKDLALKTAMYKSPGCQEQRFYDYVSGRTTDFDGITSEKLGEYRDIFINEKERPGIGIVSDSLKGDIDLEKFKKFAKSTLDAGKADAKADVEAAAKADVEAAAKAAADAAAKAAADAVAKGAPDAVAKAAAEAAAEANALSGTQNQMGSDGLVQSFTGTFTNTAYLNAGDKKCKHINTEEIYEQIFKHPKHMKQLGDLVKHIHSKFEELKKVFTPLAVDTAREKIALEIDYVRKNIITAFVWGMVIWPSIQSHTFVVQMYTAINPEKSYIINSFYGLSVLAPVLIGFLIYGGEHRREAIKAKTYKKFFDELGENMKLE